MVIWRSTFLKFQLITEGGTKRVSQFTFTLKSVSTKNSYFNGLKCIFKHCGKVKTILKFFIIVQFCPDYLFRAALYELILVLLQEPFVNFISFIPQHALQGRQGLPCTAQRWWSQPVNTKGVNITVLLTSCLTILD